MPEQMDPVVPLEHYWPYKAAVLGDLVGRHTSLVLKRHGDLNLSQWRVLAAVSEAPGRTANDVVAITPMDKGIVSRAVKTLIAQDLLKRDVDHADRRRASLSLSPLGTRVYDVIAADVKAAIAPVGRALGDVAAFIETVDAAIVAYRDIISKS